MSAGVLRRWVGAIAAGAAVPIFPVIGAGARDRIESLALRREIRLVRSPRHATVLLVAGAVPLRLQRSLDRIHDQLPHPRATLYWGADAPVPGLEGGEIPGAVAVRIDGARDPVPALVAVHRALVRGDRPSEGGRLPDRPPAPWRGLGEHGQGGEGMMGGTPYGRPMAMTEDDIRDGLALDALPFTIGPFFPPFPPGLVLRLTLQGSVVQRVEVVELPFPQPAPAAFRRALRGQVPRAEIELARARLALRRVARILRVAGADALADRALAVASTPAPKAARVRRLESLVRRGGTLLALPDVALPGGDTVRERLRALLSGAASSLTPDARAADRRDYVGPVGSLAELDPGPGAGPVGSPEGIFPHGGTSGGHRDTSEWIPERLPGLEWGEAALVLAAADPVPLDEGGAGPEKEAG